MPIDPIKKSRSSWKSNMISRRSGSSAPHWKTVFDTIAAAQQQNASNAVDLAKETTSLSNNLASSSERQFLTEALKNGIGSTNFDAVREEYNSRNAAGEFSNLIKNENEKSSSRMINQEAGKSIDERTAIEAPAKETKASREIDSLSMDALEKEIRQKVIVEKEVAQSLEILIGI